jgi:DNA end-binding protein Ku
MARPYWSGHIQISLVSFGVSLFTATESKSEIRFHQLSRKTGERIKHQKVSGEEGPIDSSDIVKGYEYRKGEYVSIEPSEIANLRIPSKHTLEVTQFVDASDIGPEYFEKPYFVVPEDNAQAEAFAVVRRALQDMKKVALGKISFSGRENLVAISPSTDDELPGMMAYTMRYAEELRKPSEYFSEIKKVAVDDDQLSLAKELIKRKAAKFDPEKFKDQYEIALRELIEAKVKHLPVPHEEAAPTSGKVVNLMDALRKSVQDGQKETPAPRGRKPPVSATAAENKGIELVKPAAKGRRKSA